MDICHVLANSVSNFVTWEFYVTQESSGDSYQSIFGPRREPIDGRIVDQGWELSGSETEGISNW